MNLMSKQKRSLKRELIILSYKFSIGDVVKPTHASGLVKFIERD